jgi:hypothetical protein
MRSARTGRCLCRRCCEKEAVPKADPLPGPSSLVLLMQRMELIDPLELRSAGGGVDLEGH